MGRLAQGGICRKRCKPGVIQRRQVQGKGQPTPSVCLLPPPTLKKLLKGCPGSGGVGEERKYLALFSLFAAILELLPEISSAPSVAGCSVAEVQSIALLSLIALLRCGGDGKSHQLKALCWEELSTKM